MIDGLYIAIEGVEGAGKSTQAALLHQRLDGSVITKEPGGTEIGAGLRSLLLHGEDMDPRTEALLMTADRLENYLNVVKPILDAGRHVITDRSYWSMIAYQGYGRALGTHLIHDLHEIAWTQLPDLVVLLEVEPVVAAERTRDKNPDRFERLGKQFFQRVRDGFEESARTRNEFIKVDGDGSIPEVADRVFAAIAEDWHLWLDSLAEEEPDHPQPLTWVLHDE